MTIRSADREWKNPCASRGCAILVERSGAQAAAVNGFSAKLDGLTSDIAMVKGGHAVAAMHRNAALIADDLGCQLIEELPQGVIVGFAKVAADNGESSSEVDSFRHADMVMYGREPAATHATSRWRPPSPSMPTTSGGLPGTPVISRSTQESNRMLRSPALRSCLRLRP